MIRQKATLEELAPRPDPGSAAARREKRAAKGGYARKSDDGNSAHKTRVYLKFIYC
jgi:hypothetical protein